MKVHNPRVLPSIAACRPFPKDVHGVVIVQNLQEKRDKQAEHSTLSTPVLGQQGFLLLCLIVETCPRTPISAPCRHPDLLRPLSHELLPEPAIRFSHIQVLTLMQVDPRGAESFLLTSLRQPALRSTEHLPSVNATRTSQKALQGSMALARHHSHHEQEGLGNSKR